MGRGCTHTHTHTHTGPPPTTHAALTLLLLLLLPAGDEVHSMLRLFKVAASGFPSKDYDMPLHASLERRWVGVQGRAGEG